MPIQNIEIWLPQTRIPSSTHIYVSWTRSQVAGREYCCVGEDSWFNSRFIFRRTRWGIALWSAGTRFWRATAGQEGPLNLMVPSNGAPAISEEHGLTPFACFILWNSISY